MALPQYQLVFAGIALTPILLAVLGPEMCACLLLLAGFGGMPLVNVEATAAGIPVWLIAEAGAVALMFATFVSRSRHEDSFFFDIAAHARFLLALPLFGIAEALLAPRLNDVVQHWNEGHRTKHERTLAGFDSRELENLLDHLGQPITRLSPRDRGQEPDRHHRLDAGALLERAQDCSVVGDGIRVRHREHAAEAARRSGTRAGLEVLFVLATRRAQVHVRVDEGREHMQALSVDDLGTREPVLAAGLPTGP